MMQATYAATIVVAFIALGELVSQYSRARVPSLLVVMVGLFVSAQIGLIPVDLVAASGLAALGSMILPAIMVHLGTLIPLSVMRRQYKAVLVATGSMVVAAALILGFLSLFYNYPTAVAGVGPLVGGLVATVMTVEGLTKTGNAALVAIPTMILIVHSLPAMPLAATILRRHAKTLLASGMEHDQVDVDGASASVSTATAPSVTKTRSQTTTAASRYTVRLPDRLAENNFVLLFIILLLGSAALGLDALTGVSYSLWGLILGVVALRGGLLPEKSLQQANGFTFAMVAIIAVVASSVLATPVDAILDVLGIVLTVLVVGLTGLVVGGAIMTKIVKWPLNLGVPVALTAAFGFPADYLITKEVADSVGQTPEERQWLLDKILPPMLIGGFTAVSAGSVVVASILVNTL